MTSTLYTGDNLTIMRTLPSASIHLIYLDPPFCSGRTYRGLPGTAAQDMSFGDSWQAVTVTDDAAQTIPGLSSLLDFAGQCHSQAMRSYLSFMAIRLAEMRRILTETGSLYLHCDPTASHYVKAMMDAIFGKKHFQNEIIWTYRRFSGRGKRWASMHDVILFYTKSATWNFHTQHRPYQNMKRIERGFDGNTQYCKKSGRKVRCLIVFDEDKARQKILEAKEKGWKIHYAVPKGAVMSTVWTDIQYLSSHQRERTGYPTQKPEALVTRIIQASSNEGDMVLDPFCGSGTTLVAAKKLCRRYIGIDQSADAISVANGRLDTIQGGLFS